MALLILVLSIAAFALATTNWSALAVPLVAAVLTLISKSKPGRDGIDSFLSVLFALIVVCGVAMVLISVCKSLIGLV